MLISSFVLSTSRIMFFLLFSSFLTLSSCLSRQYYFVNKNVNWTDAQAYCRQYYTDLATLENTNITRSLIAAVNSSYSGLVWIGLYDDVENGWRWYYDDDAFYGPGERNYRNWRKAETPIFNEPNNNGGNEMCTERMADGLWNDIPCTYQLNFICYNKMNNNYVMSQSAMTVSAARQYCRQYHTDLASIRSATENQQILNMTEGQHIWIGLHRTRTWSDQSNSTYENWLSGQPDNANFNEHCTTASLSDSGQWTDENCNLKLPFVCYKAPSESENVMMKMMLRVRFTCGRNLTESEIENEVVQQLQAQLINQGLSSNMTMHLKKLLKKTPTSLPTN